MKKNITMLMIISIILSSFGNFAYGESELKYDGYKEAYYNKLIEFRNSEELLDGDKPIGKDAALVSHFNGEIPALFTISYYKGLGGSGAYNYKYRVYIYENEKLNLVRLSQNMIDNDADYNFYSVNVGGSNEDMFKNDYYIARNKNSDMKSMLSNMEYFQEAMFDSDDEYYDKWEKDGSKIESYRLENFMTDINEDAIGDYKNLEKQTNPKNQVRYYYHDTKKQVDNPSISKEKYDNTLAKFKKDNVLRLLRPTNLNDKEIRQILLEDRDIKVVVDNKLINLNTQAIIRDNRTLVPFRSIFEALDMDIEWDGKNKIVTGIKDGQTIKLTIGSNIAYVNGEPVKLDTKAIIEKDRTLVPVRFVAESLGREVTWDKLEKIVIID